MVPWSKEYERYHRHIDNSMHRIDKTQSLKNLLKLVMCINLNIHDSYSCVACWQITHTTKSLYLGWKMLNENELRLMDVYACSTNRSFVVYCSTDLLIQLYL